jgi:hypothetical protein
MPARAVFATRRSATACRQTRFPDTATSAIWKVWLAAQVAVRQRENSFRDKFERCIARDRHNTDLRRKALTAIAAKMAGPSDAVIKSGYDYRPFVEGPVPGGRSPLYRAVGTARRDPVDNVRGSCLDRYLVSRTVRADA